MANVHERLYVEAPYTQAAGAFELRLGLSPSKPHGTCSLTLALPLSEGHEIARVVTARTERLTSGSYTSRYRIAWDPGSTRRGIPTPGFAGTLTLAAGEDYGETKLELDGSYDPPGGVAGRTFDQLVGRRIAHATLSALLGGVGDELRETHERIEAEKHRSNDAVT